MNKSKHRVKQRGISRPSPDKPVSEKQRKNSNKNKNTSRRKQLDQSSQRSELAIVAGEGSLAPIIARECIARGEKPLIIMLERGEGARAKFNHKSSLKSFQGCRVLFPESPWQALLLARKNAIKRVVFAGKYRRSSNKREGQRASRNPILAFITRLLVSRYGDDRVMRRVARLIGLFSIKVVAPQEICPSLCPARVGELGRIKANRRDRRDMQFARKILDRLAPLDIGQSVVVASGLVLGIETLEGTDALLESVKRLKKQRAIEGGVLVKLPKIGQRKDLDLPAIGVETVRRVARADLRGIAIECQGALLIPPQATIRKADVNSLFIYTLSSTPLSSTPLSSTPLSSTPLSSIPLSSIPLPVDKH